MQQTTQLIVQDLVLIGGGHTHAIALRMFAMKPIPGVRLTLITDTSHTPYSGMLPGHVAGFYDFDECHIDLRRLAEFAQAQFYLDKAIALDLENQQVICGDRPPVAFDLLSIDIGSTPANIDVPGAAEYAIPAKPVPQFLRKWQQLVDDFTKNPEKPISLSIVGGGAGGVELAMTMQRHLNHILQSKKLSSEHLQIHLFHRGTELLSSHNSWVRRRLENLLNKRGILVHLEQTVTEVFPNKIRCESNLEVASDYTFWVTQASAPNWLQESGLKTDLEGFVLVNDNLQSLYHPQIFAAGDIATMINHPRPKAGVFAVRQGKPLFENLQRSLLEKPLKPYKPQKLYLGLIGTGDGEAIASWGPFGWQSSWLWRQKDRIDRKFMEKFSDLPEMSSFSGKKLKTTNKKMYCAGCGSKVGHTTLERVLLRLQIEQYQIQREDILLGLETPDDAAVIQVPINQVMVQTVDYFRTLINDPYIFGKICTNHCLSDIFAMGATPQSALAIVTVPYATQEKVEETLYQLLSGAMSVLSQANAALVGGHTTEGTELAFGLSCNGLAIPNQLLRKNGMKPGQVLILTKALGTGTLFAANMRLLALGRWLDQAIESMLLSNQAASRIFLEHEATACTDITGFGLLGHLMEMVKASGVAVQLNLQEIPVLEGAIQTLQMGITSSLQLENLRVSNYISNLSEVSSFPEYQLLFDPQTAGGLLATIPTEQADSCLAQLKAFGYSDSQIIGQVIPAVEIAKPVTINTV